MINLYNPINFPFVTELQEATSLALYGLDIDSVYIRDIEISDQLRTSINNWLSIRGISNIHNILAFKRKTAIKNYFSCHIDTRENFTDVYASLVIPVSGCEGTAQYWYTGKYNRSEGIAPNGSKYCKLSWESPGLFLDEVGISNSAMLCRVDIPHGAYSHPGKYRTTVTLRFEANESFEYLNEKFNTPV